MKASLTAGALALALTLAAGSILAQPGPNPGAGDGARPLPLTPPQMQGPYYPVSKLADRDSDLTRVGRGALSSGTVIVLAGRVVDQRGQPAPGAKIELWQPDRNGIYMHPDDSRTEQRDKAFQYFGEATADGDGRFEFRTIVPGIYGTRPRHFHLKVTRRGGKTLTTQLYFKDDERLAQDFLTRRLGQRLAALLLEPAAQGNNELRAETVLVVE